MTETPITILNTNARSLCPKIHSFIDCFEEMDAMIAVVTETWLADGESLEGDLVDLAAGTGIGMMCRNRTPNLRGTAHGGVAVAYRKSACTTNELQFDNPEGFEVMCTLTSIPGYVRKLVTIACYLPPSMIVPRGRACLQYIEDIVIEVKRKYRDPFVVVTGDFNQWEIGEALHDFPDIHEANVGPTRKDKCIDRLFTNFDQAQRDAGTVPPLGVEPGSQGLDSDHRVAYVCANLPKVRAFEWISYKYRFYSEESSKNFGAWLAGFDWAEMTTLAGSNAKADYYQAAMDSAMDAFFPMVHVRRKTSDCPWVNNRIRRLIRRRKRVYKSCLLYTSPSPRDRQKSRMPSSA